MSEIINKLSILAVLAILLPQLAIAEIHNVSVKDNLFSPRDLLINMGDTVVWTSDSRGNCDGGGYGGGGGDNCPEHTVTADDYSFSSGASSEDISFSRVFSDAGEILYHCEEHSAPGKDINAFMNGRITIQGEQPVFQINAGLNDAWVSADAPFQGFFFTVFPDLEIFFLSWFTFESEQPDEGVTSVFGAPDQRWVTGAGAYSGNSLMVNVELTSGGIFNASEPLASQQPGYGTITIVFNSCNEAILTYSFPSTGFSEEMTLTRVVPDNVALCEALNTG